MKNISSKLLITFLIMFSFTFLFKIDSTKAVYHETKSTTISLTVAGANSYYVYFDSRGGTSVSTRVVEPNDPVGVLPIPTKAGANFAGWKDSNDQRVRHDTLITADTYLHAEWTEIVCKRVTDENELHTEVCKSGGCRANNNAGIAVNDIITYGAVGDGVPISGDAYDCDVDYNGVFDAKEADNKTYLERFYFVREKTNSNIENSAVMYYSTSFDANGRDDRVTDKSDGSYHYTLAETYLPTTTTPTTATAWDNPLLVDFDGNGKVSRFASMDDLEAVCGPVTLASTAYFASCQKWFWFENSRFQSTNVGRAGIWLEYETGDTKYHRIHTQSFDVMEVEETSENMARPVIEIPMSALEGYYDETRFTLSFSTYNNDPDPLESVKRYRGEEIGTLPTPTREHYTFAGWYTDSGLQNAVDPTTLVSSNMTLYADWTEDQQVTITMYLDGGTISGITLDNNDQFTIYSGDNLSTLADPTKSGYTFDGWYTDSGFNTSFDKTAAITTDIDLYAKWEEVLIPQVTITMYLDGGSISGITLDNNNQFTINSGDNLSTLADPTKTGYTFDGWYTDSGFNTSFDKTAAITSNTSLYAKWEVIPITITMYLDGGTITGIALDNNNQFTINYGDNLSTLQNPTKTGYIFQGWYTDSGFNTSFNKTAAITSNLSLYAKWEAGNYEARIGNTFYATLAEAVADVSGSEKTTIVILKNITLTSTISIPSGIHVELNIGNYTINSSSCILFNNSGTIDIINGTLIDTNPTAGSSASSGQGYLFFNNSTGTLNIYGGTLTYDNANSAENKPIQNIGGIVNIYGGVINNNAQSAAINNYSGGTLNITGGRIISTNSTSKGQAIYSEGNNTSTTIYISGDAYIENTTPTSGNNRRAAVDNNGKGSVIITGGTIVSKNYYAVYNRNGGNLTIGIDDNTIDTTTPILQGKLDYALVNSGTGSKSYVYDGIFKAPTAAKNGTVTTPTDTAFVQHGSETISGTTYKIFYLENSSGGPYAVTFDADNNTTPTQVSNIAVGTSVGSANMPNPTKTNYIFEKWFIYKEVDNQVYDAGEFTDTTPVEGDITVMAKWKPAIGLATINPASISIGVNGTDTITVTGPENMESYSFTSNDTNIATVDANGTVTGVGTGSTTITITGAESGDTVTINVTVDGAQTTCRVIFNTDGGPIIPDQTPTCGTALGANMPQDPTKSGYVFNGWVISGTSTSFNSTTPVTANPTTVVAQWIPSIELATIASSISVEAGSTATISMTNIPTGMETYTVASNDQTTATVNNLVVTGVLAGTTTVTITGDESGYVHTVNVTVTAPTPASCTVIFNTDGGPVISDQSTTCGTALGGNMPQNPTKSGYLFNGWKISGTSTSFDSTTPVTTNPTTVVAQWIPTISLATITPSNTTINLHINGTEQIVVTPVNGMEAYTIASSNSSIATFDSNTNTVRGVSAGTTTVVITGTSSNETITYTVIVDSQVIGYTITFDYDNGNPETVHTGVSTGTLLSTLIPQTPTKTGYIFDDWYVYDTVNDVITSTTIVSGDIIAEDRTYKAKWAPSGTVCKVNGSYYTSPQDCADSISTNDPTTIYMLADYSSNITGNQVSVIDLYTNAKYSSEVIVLDLKGHTINYTGTSKVYVVRTKADLEIKNGTIITTANGTAAVNAESGGKLRLYSGTITANGDRQGVYNDGGTVYVGGTVSINAKCSSAYNGVARGALTNYNGTMYITGGTITNTNGTAIAMGDGTMTIGVDDGTIDTTSMVATGKTYGLEVKTGSSVTIYDGMFKGKTLGIKDTTQTTHPSGTDYDTDDDDVVNNYKLAYLYYNVPTPTPTATATPEPTATPMPTATPTPSPTATPVPATYTITFSSAGGTVSPSSATVTQGSPVTNNDLPTTAEWGDKTLAGWYEDEDYNTAVVPGTTTPSDDATYYAKWTITPSGSIPTFRTTNDAMVGYYSNISTWKNSSANFPTWTDSNKASAWSQDSPSTTPMFKNFVDNDCACYDGQCASANSGSTRCDLPKGYSTGVSGAVDVYLYDETTHVIGEKINYAKATSGTIYNLVPGQAYYWENHSDPTEYGFIKFTGERRILNTGDVRNTRDLGGLTVVDSNGNTIGHLKYERLYRGMKLESSSSVTELTNLGINSELDLREANNDANRLSRYERKEAQNYYVIPYTTQNPAHTPNSTESNYYTITRQGVKYAMEEIVAGRNVFFHCRIGADRTGTVAYILEGLLGVSEEDRIQDYELSFFSGLVRIHRYHDYKPGSSIGTGHERFTYMHELMPTNQKIYEWYMFANGNDQDKIDADDDLIARFKAAIIEYN